MKRVAFGALVALLSFHTTSVRAADPLDPDARIVRLERMIRTALAHHPGERDETVTEVGLWSNAELRLLRVDELLMVRLLRRPGLKIAARVVDDRTIPEYTAWQVRRLKELADDYRPRNTDDNIPVRMALLHGEVAMSSPSQAFTPDSSAGVKIQIGDGESRGLNGVSAHWDMARTLFDAVKDNRRAADLARRWYIATSMLMQNVESHDTTHLKHAREMFPDDVELQFLSGCQQEAYASAAIQAAARSAVLPTGYHVEVPSEGVALRNAEEFLRRTLQLNPQHHEARMHLGHVLIARGRPAEAAEELLKVVFAEADFESRYFREMFLGAAQEGAGRLDAARDAYLRAAEIESGAQSPHLALSALAMRQGDRKGALREIDRVFELPSAIERHSTDSWWVYRVTQARRTDERFEALYASVAETTR